MGRALDPKVTEVLKADGFGKEAVWDCHGTWVVYHRVLEQIAARRGIKFDQPFVVEANGKEKIAAICVTGNLGDQIEWSIGEAAPYNNKNAYPYAMAEKRAKDRVILKLIGLHGLAYSEDEADEFKGAPPPGKTPADNLIEQAGEAQTITQLKEWWGRPSVQEVYSNLATPDQKRVNARVNGLKKSLPGEAA